MSLLLWGCGDDAPVQTVADASPDRRVWVPPDVGPFPVRDAMSSGDSGPDNRVCAQRVSVDPTRGPWCAAATEDCVAACVGASDEDACRSACYAADGTPPRDGFGCGECLFNQILFCADREGCRSEVADWWCCLQEECIANGLGEECFDTTCGALAQGFIGCVINTAPECGRFARSPDTDACYADVEPTDAGIDGAVDAAVDASIDAGTGDT